MPYLPATSDPTVFPDASGGQDLVTALGLIRDKFRRFYPLVPYYPIRKAVTHVTGAPAATPVGEAATTKFDRLYGEAVDPAMTAWRQPHGSGDLKAADVDLFGTPVNLNVRIQTEATDDELHLWGFEDKKDVIAFVPTMALDAVGVTAQVGDYFRWNGPEYTVLFVGRGPKWKNTNTQLYVVLNCQTRRRGS